MAEDLADYLSDPLAVLPEPVNAEQAAEQILRLYERGGYQGATFNLYFGDLSGQPLDAVALYSDLMLEPEPGRSVELRVLRALIVQNQDLLRDPRNSIGLWYDEGSGLLYLDVSATLPDHASAIGLGQQYNQIEVFDLMRGESITTGGTGEAISHLPPVEERLPKLRRGVRDT